MWVACHTGGSFGRFFVCPKYQEVPCGLKTSNGGIAVFKYIAVACVVLAGCTEQSVSSAPQKASPDANSNNDAGAKTIQPFLGALTEGELPACDESIRNTLVWVPSDQTFRHCSGSAWNVISIQGPKGDKGDRGDQGPVGVSADLLGYATVAGKQLAVVREAEEGYVARIAHRTAGFLFANLGEGGLASTKATFYIPEQSDNMLCAFTTEDCSGTCYLDYGNIPLGVFAYDPNVQKWFYATPGAPTLSIRVRSWTAHMENSTCYTPDRGEYIPDVVGYDTDYAMMVPELNWNDVE